jgi:hypothetical protein
MKKKEVQIIVVLKKQKLRDLYTKSSVIREVKRNKLQWAECAFGMVQ